MFDSKEVNQVFKDIDGLEVRIREVLEKEKELRTLEHMHMQATKAENLLRYADEIKRMARAVLVITLFRETT